METGFFFRTNLAAATLVGLEDNSRGRGGGVEARQRTPGGVLCLIRSIISVGENQGLIQWAAEH